MNNKGFMMAEVVVVSSIVLVFLAGLYMSYNKVFAVYKTRVSYYDTTALYDLAYYRDRLIVEKFKTENNSKMNKLLYSYFVNDASRYAISVIGTGDYRLSSKLNYSAYGNDNQSEIIYLIHNKMKAVEVSKFKDTTQSSMSETFKDYIGYLSTSIDFKSNYIMLMERCKSGDKGKYDCKYAYLEVYDGKE